MVVIYAKLQRNVSLFDSDFPILFSVHFDQLSSSSSSHDDEEPTQEPASSMFTVWNLVADLLESQDQKEVQQQVSDFYGKAGTTFPRLACLMQLYFNSAEILERVKDFVIFSEGDEHNSVINDNFVRSVEAIIKRDYYKYDKTYLPYMSVNQDVVEPMVIVEKEAVLAAWTWYEHYLDVAATLFTIDPNFSGKPVVVSSSNTPESKTIKQMIMLFDFNIFPISAITVKHPITGLTYVE